MKTEIKQFVTVYPQIVGNAKYSPDDFKSSGEWGPLSIKPQKPIFYTYFNLYFNQF